MPVALVDLMAPYQLIKDDVLSAIEGVLDSMLLYLDPNCAGESKT